jgi:hypothetical protein
MTATDARSFRTKTGRCVVYDDRIELEREGARGALASAVVGTSVQRILAIYGIAALGFAFCSLRGALQGDYVTAGLFGLLSAYLVRGIVRSRGLSATNRLIRRDISRIEAHPPKPPVARGHFVVHFVENGRALRRMVILPGVAQGGNAEYDLAVALLRAEGFELG